MAGEIGFIPSNTCLICAKCGHNYTHHRLVETFARDEDEETGVHVTASDEGYVSIEKDLHGNPSGRRGGIVIKLECEDCGGYSVLIIAQHKGITTIEYH